MSRWELHKVRNFPYVFFNFYSFSFFIKRFFLPLLVQNITVINFIDMDYVSKSSILNIANSTLNCEHPLVIFHPYFRVRFQRWKMCQLGPMFIGLKDKSSSWISRNWFKLMKSKFIPARYSCDFNHLDDYYVIDDEGQTYPVFLAVPCCHCSLCAKSRQDEFTNRCLLETYSSDYKPLFITLTYDNEHLPYDGVSVRDCQLFLKRLRKNLHTYFKHNVYIRYCIVSEYGHNTHRPHYHMLLWNMPYFAYSYLPFGHSSYPLPGKDYSAFSHMCNFIKNSWKNGFVSVQVQKDVTGKYLAKYIGKGSDVPFGKNRCFLLSSRKRGLGFGAFKEFKQFLLDNPTQTTISFTDPKVGSTVTIPIPRYYQRLLCPSPSSFIKDDFKEKYLLFVNKCYGVLSFTSSSNYASPLRKDVLHMLNGLLEVFEPIQSYLTPDDIPFLSKSLFPQYYQAVTECNFDVSQLYFDACFLYDELLNYIPEFDWYLSALNWKEQFTLFLKSDTSPKKCVPDKVFTFNLYNNKLIEKSIL